MLARFKFWDHSEARKSDNWIFGTMLGFGLLGLVASFVLTLDKFRVLENPHAQLSCSVNLVINCSTVMQTAQASLFGFPNSLLGVMLFPLVIFIAVLGLMRLKLPNVFWGIVNIGFLLGTIFSYWLFFQSVYVIQVLCPWCLLVTLTMTILLSTIFQHNLR
ncbi:MAG: vitamin K epoxide reductase family protein, partial [Segetibacter sp.]